MTPRANTEGCDTLLGDDREVVRRKSCPAYFLLSFFLVILLAMFYHAASPLWKEKGDDYLRTGAGIVDVPPGCRRGCATPFGSVLGEYNGVKGMSNCDSDTCIADHWHTIDVSELRDAIRMETFPSSYGVKWQCVEYARRYWVLRGTPKPAAFGSVEGAADIWDLDNVALLDGTTRPLLKFQNENATAAGSRPRAGDLLIYPRQPNGFPYGHVAVVAGVEERRLFVAEQNWDNQQWPGPYHNYSRELKLTCDASSTRCSVHEEGNIVVQGWVRYE
uniref:WGS project CAEQ00000000 data, annotated contig 1829 n=1 Tax=Trypanosoma congolense (strain IL3000) TaxID=1068625 RepID=F9W970_TRYCI|nr:unnamed protein product [Trypanosoma congolense IL3000]